MDLIFVLLTQLINLTTFQIDFQVDHGRPLLPRLRGGKTRFAKLSRILRKIRGSHPGWKIRVMIDGQFTGIELDPLVMLNFARVVFRVEENGPNAVLYVDGVRENCGNDFLLRHRFFGCMRNIYWNRRPVESIDRSDSRLATKLRNLDGHRSQLNWASCDDMQKRNESTQKKIPKMITQDPPIDNRKTPPAQNAKLKDDYGTTPDSHTRPSSQPTTLPVTRDGTYNKNPKYGSTPDPHTRPSSQPTTRPVTCDGTYNKNPKDAPKKVGPLMENGGNCFFHGMVFFFAFIIFVSVKFLF